MAVVVDVDLAVEVRVAAVGVHDQRVVPVTVCPAQSRGGGGGDALDLRGGGDADGGEVARSRAALRGDDAAAVPSAAVAARGDQRHDRRDRACW